MLHLLNQALVRLFCARFPRNYNWAHYILLERRPACISLVLLLVHVFGTFGKSSIFGLLSVA